ncbi:MAG: hypothetical protein KIT17_23120 [Rubrivivax sp.]|nr:hypothetical protein [Rubrivivax sp.]
MAATMVRAGACDGAADIARSHPAATLARIDEVCAGIAHASVEPGGRAMNPSIDDAVRAVPATRAAVAGAAVPGHPARAEAPPWLYRSEAFAEDVQDLVTSLPQWPAGTTVRCPLEASDATDGSRAADPPRADGERGDADDLAARAQWLGLGPRLGWQGA